MSLSQTSYLPVPLLRGSTLTSAWLWSILTIATPEFVVGPVLIFALNVVVDFWLEYRTQKRYKKVAGMAWVRARTYVLVAGGVLVMSWMFGVVGVLHRAVLGGIAGVEFVVALGMLAKINPYLRPFYQSTVGWLDRNTPITITREEVDDLIDDSS